MTVANVFVEEINGVDVTNVGGAHNTITAGRYCTMDSFNPSDQNPCVVPATGYNYSYWKTIDLGFNGTFTTIQNIRWYCSGLIGGSNGTWQLGAAGKLLVGIRSTGASGCPTHTVKHGSDFYQIASGTLGSTGYAITDQANGHVYYKTAPNGVGNADDYKSTSQLLVDDGPYHVAGFSKAVVTQVMLDTDAIQGDKPNETFTFRYDEI